jgi:hypothetical protein
MIIVNNEWVRMWEGLAATSFPSLPLVSRHLLSGTDKITTSNRKEIRRCDRDLK